MARELVDLSTLDLTSPVMEDEEIRSLVPHDHEFKMIDGVVHLDMERGLIVAYKDWGDDPWWGKGHIPGRPLMPGVMMVEGCAQASTILMKKREKLDPGRFMGLAGLNDVRFRGQVVPPCRIHFVSEAKPGRGRKILKYPAQCFLEGNLVMQMELLGVVL